MPFVNASIRLHERLALLQIATTCQFQLASGYYNVTASYSAIGTLQILSGVGLPTITYNPDGMGRVGSVAASSGTNPVPPTPGVSYNAASQVTGLTFGSSDTVSFNYYSTTGRMQEYKMTINGSATSGDLTWNANGSLQQLAIIDPFNAADVQTCSYTADDLARIASVNCLNGTTHVWNQTFTYDPFGNITKSTSGPGIAWMPGYDNPPTNHYASGSRATYDPDGNLTYDTFHTYAWNVDSNPTTLDSTTIIYDALGREVEQQNGTSSTEFAFGPTGKLAVMNGQTQSRAFVPLPGGTKVKYTGSSLITYRLPDWLGSLRVSSNPNRTYSAGVAFAPFGEPYAVKNGPSLSFTGEEGTADTVGDEYDFLARKLHPTQGRWLSPDPAGLDAADAGNPQSWNRYAYVNNKPLALVDPTGLMTSDRSSQDIIDSSDCGWAGFNDFGPDFCFLGPEEDLLNPFAASGRLSILEGENSVNLRIGTGNPIADLWQQGLDLPSLPCQSQFGPWCDASMLPNPWILDAEPGAANTATIGAYHPSVGECLWQAAVDAGEDLLGISMIPGTNQDNWEWSSAKLGFVYTGAGEDALLTASNAATAVETATDFVTENPAAQGEIRQLLRNQGVKVSMKHVAKDAAVLGKWAGRAGKVLAAKTAYDRYQQCRGF